MNYLTCSLLLRNWSKVFVSAFSGCLRPGGARKESAFRRIYQIMDRRNVRAWGILVGILTLLRPLYSAEMVVIRAGTSSFQERQELEDVCRFYGLDVRVVTVSSDNPKFGTTAITSDKTAAVAIEGEALKVINRKALLLQLRAARGKAIPLLILGVTTRTDRAQLGEWSGADLIGINSLRNNSALHYHVGHVPDVSRQLTDIDFPFSGNETPYLQLKEGNKARVILSVVGGDQTVPVFIEEDLEGQRVFVLCKSNPAGSVAIESALDNAEVVFGRVAALMMFAKYAAGDRGWHAPRHFANLTIDDPWLHEPYGNLSYTGLLGEMEKHNFHTTIAFIPWNYDRNESSTVSLFRRYPDRFSICVHGDDHAHKEFTDYASKPLAVQVSALKQAVVRMEGFRERTGIPYDRVMVFPHSIAPEQTLAALKASDYLATVNSQNVPMGSTRPAGSLFALRPVTLAFGGLPSILRYSVADPTPRYRIMINEFLDNPLFFYAHQDYFAKSLSAFDEVADEVNASEPDTRWSGVGEIVRHLYVVKQREDGDFDVVGFTSELSLENTSPREATFHVRKEETGPGVVSASVDGERFPYQLKDGDLQLSVRIPAGQSRNVSIKYSSSKDFSGISPSKGSLYVYSLRMASDFRDMTLSKVSLGQRVTRFYYARGLTPSFAILCMCGVIVLFVSGAGFAVLVHRRRESSRRGDLVGSGRASAASSVR